MRVSTIRPLKIQNLILPDEIKGNYWIDSIDVNGIKRNLISIEAENGKWKLISNKEVYYEVNNEIQPYVYLEEGKFYNIKNEVAKESFFIYCSPVISEYNCYEVEDILNNGIKIGSSNECFIKFENIDPIACFIQNIDNKLYLVDNNSKCGIYINDIRVISKREIKLGDIIFIGGLKIILSVVNNKRCLYVNNVFLNNIIVNNEKIENIIPMNTSFEESKEEIEFPLYDESEFFHKMPRFVQDSHPIELQIDPPPSKQNDENKSMLLTIGPMITMSMTSMVTGYTAISSVLSGDTTWKRAIPSLVICFTMFASVFVWPLVTRYFNNKQKKENELLRQSKYSKYIEEKRFYIENAKKEQAAILNNNYMTTNDAVNTILKRYTGLWQRRVEDKDFLEVNLGIGAYPMDINIKYPEEHFSMDEDNLKELVVKLGQEPKMLYNVPIIFSLKENFISGIIGNYEINEYVKRLLIQLLALHSYNNLKIIVLTNEEKEYHWNFLKHVPHIFTDNKKLRFFAINNDEYKEVCYFLKKIFEDRKEKKNESENNNDYNEHYLIITDSFKRVRDFDIIKEIIDNNEYLGFSIIILESKITGLPDKCSKFISIGQNKGELGNNKNVNDNIKFSVDLVSEINYEECAKVLANIPVELSGDEENLLVDKLGFLEMYDVGKIEQLNSLSRWEKNNPILNLQVPVGISKNGDKVNIDLHEKYHGPHGLIAGMTGSGKSEFIITYILSMAINYHPNEVQFILIDYKGGGLAGAFENKNTGLKLPHLVGTITNLDTNEINRSLASIESELKRRQALFNKAREITQESTIDIYKYQKMYREGVVKEPVSHLFIISDEFAELKNQQPEFMEQLISTARIGRSLGVHLILATQKPSGVVDPQIWSNTRFRVCMRVQDKSDSNEVIKCPDAAYLKKTGRFYFQVGYNEVFILGQAAYAGVKYIPREKVLKTLDTSIDFIDNIGYTIKKVDTKEKVENNIIQYGEELTNLVKYLDFIAKEQNVNCRPLWLEKISPDIRIENLSVKYNYAKENYIINPIVGEYDVPSMQEQRLLTVPLTKEGNALIYGSSGSGKENFITTLIYSSMEYYSPEEINYYVIDFGSESLKMFDSYPIVGDILSSDDEEKIRNLFKMINTIIEERKILFSDYNGDYTTYCKNSGKTVPNIVVVINNYESFQETNIKYDEELTILSRDSNRYGIFFVLTINTPNGVRFRLKQNFSLVYCLQQNNEDDYYSILGSIQKNYPAKIFGRGILKIDNIYEFQTAMVTDKDNIIKFIKDKKNEYLTKYSSKAKKIPTLPKVVGYQDIKNEFGKTKELIIGIDKNSLEVTKFDFIKNYITIISSLEISSINNFINPLINQIIALNNTDLCVLNAEEFDITEKYRGQYKYFDNYFNEVLTSLFENIDKKYNEYIKNNYNKNIFANKKIIQCIIIGLDNLMKRLNEDVKNKLMDLFNRAKDLGVLNFIIIDSVDKIRKIENDSWYRNGVNNNYGIWLGNGINDQFIIKLTHRITNMKEDVPSNFCFVIKKGKVQYVKFVENLELSL